MLTTLQLELVAAVRKHAYANYNKGGWDYVIETMDDADIAKEFGKAKTAAGAIRKLGRLCRNLNERRLGAMCGF